jgi:hypothetical protein
VAPFYSSHRVKARVTAWQFRIILSRYVGTFAAWKRCRARAVTSQPDPKTHGHSAAATIALRHVVQSPQAFGDDLKEPLQLSLVADGPGCNTK